MVAVQAIHDIFFYTGVIKQMPYGHNDMIDTFKKYAEDLGATIIGGDALLMIGSTGFALLYKYLPVQTFISISSLFVYALPYILYTRNPFEVEEAKKKDDLEKVKKSGGGEVFENPNSIKIDAYNRMV